MEILDFLNSLENWKIKFWKRFKESNFYFFISSNVYIAD
jgi:hypothetical protein